MTGVQTCALPICAQALLDAFQRLCVSLQRAGHDGVKASALLQKMFPQASALAPAEFTELIVIGGPKGGLSVTDKVEGSHGGALCHDLEWPSPRCATGRTAAALVQPRDDKDSQRSRACIN